MKGNPMSSKSDEQRLMQIAICKTKKNRRLKNRRKMNAKLRNAGVKFSHKDAAYKSSLNKG